MSFWISGSFECVLVQNAGNFDREHSFTRTFLNGNRGDAYFRDNGLFAKKILKYFPLCCKHV